MGKMAMFVNFFATLGGWSGRGGNFCCDAWGVLTNFDWEVQRESRSLTLKRLD
jgi:hypothetical protein